MWQADIYIYRYGSFMATRKGEHVTNVMIIDQPKFLSGDLRQINRITILVDKFSGHPKVGDSVGYLPRWRLLWFLDPYQKKKLLEKQNFGENTQLRLLIFEMASISRFDK